ncbi:T9SS type A sorting domain-containing protein [Cryomorphaceae bacterium 1068]|nr:T9SS type A sorting domain-containing protein [Cryomorphaceae bacterium 1068]
MKIKIFIFLTGLILVKSASAQIDLIGEYQADQSQLVLVDDNLLKVFTSNYDEGSFTLYNLDNTIYREIDIPQVGISGTHFVYFISRSLFDCDTTTVEYVLYNADMSPMGGVDNRWVRVYREDGTELLYVADATIAGTPTSYSVVNTGWIQNSEMGAVLKIGLVSDFNPLPETHQYYQLCGSVPIMNRSAVMGELTGLWEAGSGSDDRFVIYPNPTESDIIQFELDEYSKGQDGVIRFFNMNGQLVKEEQIYFLDSLQSIDVSDLSFGTYLLNVQLVDGTIVNEKLVKL